MDSFLLYQFTCDACNCVYIGETRRHFLVRSCEHLGLSIFTGKDLGYNENTATAIRKHCHNENHPSGVGDFRVIGHASSHFHLLLKEALTIQVVKPTIINVQKFSLPLYLFGK